MFKKDNILYKSGRYSFYDQIKRCNNPNNKFYKWYGGKGVRVEYSLDEFLNWYYLNAIGFKNPSVDRIDSNKNYCLENIRILERSDNSKERISRLGTPLKRRPVIMLKDGVFVMEFESAYHAGRYLNCSTSGIPRAIKRNIKCKGYNFAYKE